MKRITDRRSIARKSSEKSLIPSRSSRSVTLAGDFGERSGDLQGSGA
ncbi:hypothetical protein V0288_22080 [Pannus brasiliensis CCIBt3594]|uniref:Uncharacterized protein n=1 Tax=Pannus brasiliensis CCIBt3594 TaxID=1427578 RepID=A0AAW9R088_9CHRO